jgi:hypothetical protein
MGTNFGTHMSTDTTLYMQNIISRETIIYGSGIGILNQKGPQNLRQKKCASLHHD